MSNIIDKIRVSGTDYTLSATSSGGNPTIEVTQAEYDALVSAGTVQEDTYYIITDSSIDYINSAQCQSQIDSSISGKADTSAVTEAINAAVSGKVDTSTYTAYTAATDSRIYGVESELSSKVDKIYLDNRYEDGVKIEYYGSNGGHYIDDLTLFDVGSGLTMEFSGNTWVLSATGGSGTVSSAITSGDTNAVAGGAVYDKFDEVEQVTAQALNVLNESLSGKADSSAVTQEITAAVSGKLDASTFETYSASVETALSGKAAQNDLNTLSGTVTAHTADTTVHVTTSEKNTWNGKANSATTISGYGITDAYTKTEIDNKIGDIEALLAAI